MPDTIAQRFTLAFGGNDIDALTALYDEEVALYGPLTWPLRGRQALLEYVGEFIRAYNPRIVLHDEFYDAAGTRGCFTFVFHWHNTEPFYGHAPTGERGVMVETHAITIRDGRIVEQWVGDNSFQMPYMDLVTYGMDFPRDTPHPKPPIVEASVGVGP
jgi:SnoaL-like domain